MSLFVYCNCFSTAICPTDVKHLEESEQVISVQQLTLINLIKLVNLWIQYDNRNETDCCARLNALIRLN